MIAAVAMLATPLAVPFGLLLSTHLTPGLGSRGPAAHAAQAAGGGGGTAAGTPNPHRGTGSHHHNYPKKEKDQQR